MASLGEDLLHVVNKLQDLVFNTIGNDSLDLPQIVWTPCEYPLLNLKLTRTTGRRWISIVRKVLSPRKHSRQRLFTERKRHRHSATPYSPAHKRT